MVETKTVSDWQGSHEYIGFLKIIWEKNLAYSEQINESRDISLTLKALSDFYYGLYSFRSAIIFFVETLPEHSDKIKKILADIKTQTGGQEFIQCPLNWEEIRKIRDLLLELQDELYKVAGKSRLLVGFSVKKQYETLGEELDEENA